MEGVIVGGSYTENRSVKSVESHVIRLDYQDQVGATLKIEYDIRAIVLDDLVSI